MKTIRKILKALKIVLFTGFAFLIVVVGIGTYNAYDDYTTKAATAKAKPKPPMTKEQILAKLKVLPAARATENLELYKKLVIMEPDNAKYAAKVTHYTTKVKEQQKVKEKAEARQMARKVLFGDKPSSYIVKLHLRKVANDPDSIEVDTCTDAYIDEEKGWLLGCDYRGRNGFGGMVRKSNWFVIRQLQVVQVLDASTYNIK